MAVESLPAMYDGSVSSGGDKTNQIGKLWTKQMLSFSWKGFVFSAIQQHHLTDGRVCIKGPVWRPFFHLLPLITTLQETDRVSYTEVKTSAFLTDLPQVPPPSLAVNKNKNRAHLLLEQHTQPGAVPRAQNSQAAVKCPPSSTESSPSAVVPAFQLCLPFELSTYFRIGGEVETTGRRNIQPQTSRPGAAGLTPKPSTACFT